MPTLRQRSKLALVLAVVLLAAFAVLAVLQYRWIQEAAEAERQRMQTSIQVAAGRFAEEFNGEAARALFALMRGQNSPLQGGYGELYLQWTATAAYPKIVRNVFVVERTDARTFRLLQFDTAAKELTPLDWPRHLVDVKEWLANEFANAGSEPPPWEPQANVFLSREPPTAVAPLAPFPSGLVGPPSSPHYVAPRH